MDCEPDSRYENGWEAGLQGRDGIDESPGKLGVPTGMRAFLALLAQSSVLT